MNNNNYLSVIGISRSEGDYNGTHFDNTYLHCIKPADETKGQKGQITEIIKVKTTSLDVIPAINSFIVPYYNKFGQVQAIEIV